MSSRPPLDQLSQTNQVCGQISFFKLSYFDCSDHFHGREIGWSTVSTNSKLKEAKNPYRNWRVYVLLYYLKGSL